MLAIWLTTAVIHAAYGYSLKPLAHSTVQETNIQNVESLAIHPGQGVWYCDLKICDHVYRVELTESWRLNPIQFPRQLMTLVATQGTTYEQNYNIWLETGPASISFVETPYGIEAKGSLTLSDGLLWHLHSISGTKNYWVSTKDPLKNTAQLPLNNLPAFLPPDPWLSKRTVSSRSLWPSLQDLRDLAEDLDSCFLDQVVALVGVAADENYLSTFESLPAAYLHIADTINKASRFWEAAFNISLSLNEIVTAHSNQSFIWNWPCDPQINDVTNMKQRLLALSRWRKANRASDIIATWALFTDCPSADVFGLAWQGSACTSGSVIVIRRSPLEHRVFAHEMGHLFGAIHDCTAGACDSQSLCCPQSREQCDAQDKYIMSPGSTPRQNAFSECSRQNVCAAMRHQHVDTHCLLPRNTVPEIHNTLCSQITDSLAFEACLRDLQCRDFTNSTEARSCGNLAQCYLQCEDPITKTCRDFGVVLLDGTPCGDPQHERGGLCVRGSCHRKNPFVPKPIWMRFLSSFAIILVGLAVATGIAFVAVWYYRRATTPPEPEISMPQPAPYPSFTHFPKPTTERAPARSNEPVIAG